MEYQPSGKEMAAGSSSGSTSPSLLRMMDDATARLQRMEISCRDALVVESATCARDDVALFRLQVAALKAQLVGVVHAREDSDAVFQRAMDYASAKGTANGVLHALFDQASAAKCQVLEHWLATGVIPTRDGLRHWRLDARSVRNEAGATLLHVACDTSMARQPFKAQCVALLVDRMGFDVNVRDAFGRTPLHVAAMAGYAEVTQALLARGADATLRDRAGLTPLSVVRTLSKPPEEIVQLLAAAETTAARQYKAVSEQVAPTTAIASALFLRTLVPFVRAPFVDGFSRQIDGLLDVLLTQKDELAVALDRVLQVQVSLLFESRKQPPHAHEDWAMTGSESASDLVRLDTLFDNAMYRDPQFADELKVEAAAYGHSLVTSTSTTAAVRAGATWEGFILRLIQAFKLEMATPPVDSPSKGTQGISSANMQGDAMSETQSSSVSGHAESVATSPLPSPSTRSLIYADRVATAHSRQAWHYAVLFKSSTQPIPGTLAVKKGQSTVVCSENVSRFFPLEDRLIIGSSDYHCVSYDHASRTIELDREYEGANADVMKAYLAGAGSSQFPPYIAAKRIWEREPGNMYEDHMSAEQDLFQDYQFLDPDSEYEAAVKLGPVPTAQEAKAIVDAWKAQARKLFEEKTCISGLASCQHYCPQRSGHSLCVETMAAIGRDIAKERFGRPTYSKPLKPRASLQKYQDLYLGKAPWPGSPSTGAPELSGDINGSSSPLPEFT